MNLKVMDEVNPQKAAFVAGKIGVPTEVLMGWLIDERIPRSYAMKMAKLFNKPVESFTKGLYKPPRYKRNRQQWEQSCSNAE